VCGNPEKNAGGMSVDIPSHFWHTPDHLEFSPSDWAGEDGGGIKSTKKKEADNHNENQIHNCNRSNLYWDS
jgi:hypothetical protein